LPTDVAPDPGYLFEHSDVHLWYHGTAATWPLANDGTHTVPTGWYSGAMGPRDRNGYYFSRIAGGNRTATESRDGLLTAFGGDSVGFPVAPTHDGNAWPNIAYVGKVQTGNSFTKGTTLNITWKYQDFDSTTDTYLYLDPDRNPYNNNFVAGDPARPVSGDLLARGHVNRLSTGTVIVGGGTELYTGGSVLTGTDYYVCARIQDGTNRRYAYLETPIRFAATPTDTTRPQVQDLTALDITAAGGTGYAFSVQYGDDVAVDVSDLDSNDVLVGNGQGFAAFAQLIGVNTNSDGTPRTGTYRILAPGGTWDRFDNGTYTITMQPGEVSDTSGNFVAGGTLGSFEVNIGDTTRPTADLTSPVNGATVTAGAIVSQGYIEVTFSTGPSGLDLNSILDGPPEFSITPAVTLGTVGRVSGRPNTFEYEFSGSFPDGPVTVNFLVGTFADMAGNTNVAETEGFTVGTTPPPGAVVNVTAIDAEAAEALRDPAVFRFSRTGATASPLTVTIQRSGTATAFVDYDYNQNFVIPAGAEYGDLVLTPIDDNDVEGSESVTLSIGSSPSYSVGVPAAATITISDNEVTAQTVTVAAIDDRASETPGDSATFRVFRTGTTEASLGIAAELIGTADYGTDYQFLPVLRIPAGASFIDVEIIAIDDSLIEGDETVTLRLAPSVAYTLGTSAIATATIHDNDELPRPTVTVNQSASQPDPTGDSPIRFTVIFSEPVSGFDSSDLLVTGTAGFTGYALSGAGAVYEVVVGPMTGVGTVIINVPAGVATNAAGTPNAAATSSDNVVTYVTNRKTWSGAVNSDWFEPGNWSPAGIPTAAEKVTVVGGTVDMASSTSSAFFDELFLNAGTLNWTAGSFAGVVNVAAGAVVNVAGAADRTMGTFKNSGTMNWSGAGGLHAGGGLAVNNSSGALFDVQGDGSLGHGWGAQPVFNNAGTFRKSGGVGTTRLEAVPFSNSGTVEALRGTLAFEAGYSQASGGRLDIAMSAADPGTGYGSLNVRGAVTLDGALGGVVSFVPVAGQQFTIIANDGSDPVSGIFAGLPGNAPLTLNGRQFRISYAGGDGNDVTLISVPLPLPTVTGVHVAGSAWQLPFTQFLLDRGLGAAQLGFNIPAGPDQATLLPWMNLNQISITFSQDVQVDATDLTVRGTGAGDYALDLAAFSYNALTRTATWRLPAGQTFGNDRILLVLDCDSPNGVRTAAGDFLDGDWVNPSASAAGGDAFPSGDGTPGGDFLFRINILPGDVDRSGTVLADDFSGVKRRFFRSTTNPGTGDGAYGVFHDVDGSGSILANDFSEVKRRFFNRLPEGQPTIHNAFSDASMPVSHRPTARPPRRGVLDWDQPALLA
jgi:hypothetical protein